MNADPIISALQPAVESFVDDLNAVLRIVEDSNIDDESRTLLAGALIQVLSANAVLPGVRGVLQRAGHVMVIAIALKRVHRTSPEALAAHIRPDVTLLGSADAIVDATRAFLGDAYAVLEHTVDNFSKLNYQGHDAAGCIRDIESATWLYDSVYENFLEDETDSAVIARELKQIDRIVDPLRARFVRHQAGHRPG